MTADEPLMLKKLTICLAMLGFCLIAGYGIFVGVLSIQMGAHHPERDAFWVPMLAGGFGILILTWAFYRFARFVHHRAKRSDRLRF